MDLKEIRRKVLEWNYLTQDEEKRVCCEQSNFFSNGRSVSFSSSALFGGVSLLVWLFLRIYSARGFGSIM
jgi:hypothetical protein